MMMMLNHLQGVDLVTDQIESEGDVVLGGGQ